MIEKLNDLTHDCILTFDSTIRSYDFLLIADVHFDSVSCDRELLKKHLDEVVERNAKVLIFGDFFDVMGGKFDKRSSKGDLRPEYNTSNYIDNVVDDAIDFLTPYKEYIMFISPGNHELSILKYHETDVIKRLAKALDAEVGTYGGWLRIRYSFKDAGNRGSYKIAYNHGYGGGGPVTKDVIQTNRKAVYLPDADIVISGHCFDTETEILTTNGWITYNNITLDTEVATMNLDSKLMEYQKVNSIHTYDDYTELQHVKCKGIDIMTTDKHGMIYKSYRHGTIHKCEMSEFITKKEVEIFNSCEGYNQTIGLFEDKYLYLAAWIVSDGSITQKAIKFHFNKERKINRVEELLNKADITYTKSISKKGNTKLYISVEQSTKILEHLELKDKNFSKSYYLLDARQCDIVLNEYRYADGHSTETHDSYVLYAKNDINLNVLQSMCIKTNRKSTLYDELEKGRLFRLNVSTKSTTFMSKVKHETVDYKGKVWCVNVDNGSLIVRRNGCVAVTQNTHDRWVFPIPRERFLQSGKIVQDEQIHLKLGSYKYSYSKGNSWERQMGHPPKSDPGVWMTIYLTNKHNKVKRKFELAEN